MITRKQMMLEVGIKNLLIVLIFSGFYTPWTIAPIQEIPFEIQESLVSLMGFLMAAAIIGAFELSYSRTNLNDKLQRFLAHFTKLTLYTSILLLMQIAITSMSITPGKFIWVLVMAASPVGMSLFLYDLWDALRALDRKT